MNKKIKILIIEDNQTIRRALTLKIESDEYEVLSAENGKEGLEKINEYQPDLIVMDVIMPELDGFDVLKKIKEKDEISKIPLIIFSELAQKTDKEKVIELGANEYLVKSDSSLKDVVSRIQKYFK